MLIFGLYEGQRLTLDVGVGKKVKGVRGMIQAMLNITVDNDKHDRKVLVLSWAGSDLQDSWVFSDLGIVPGTTIHVHLKEEVKPVLHIRCSHSQETHSVYDNMVIGHMHMDELRSLASRKTGLPIGIFRMVLKNGTEMYDGHRLEDYGIDVGDTVYLETLDGWSEFLNLAVMGFTPQVSAEEVTGRYQMKVALFLAAHFGHVDLARAMLRLGVKASKPVGYCPERMWCSGQPEQEPGHVESLKAPVHQAVEMGQLGVLRVFVNNDITVVTAQDGEGLRPLNIALRKKVKNCASFLLTKQWSKINITKTFGLHIGTYACLREWCERAKERAFVKYGQAKSSLKRRPFQTGPLVGFGVCVDGFSPSVMNGKSKAQVQREKEREEKRKLKNSQQSTTQATLDNGLSQAGNDPEAYFRQVLAIQNLKTMGDTVKGGKWGRIASRTASKTNQAPPSEAATARSQKTPEPTPILKPQQSGRIGSSQSEMDNPPADDIGETLRLPPIQISTARTPKTARAYPQAQSQQSIITVSSSAVESGRDSQLPQLQQQQQQQQASSGVSGGCGDSSGEERKDGKGVMMPRLVTSRGIAYFMASGSKQRSATTVKVPSLQLPSTDRSERGKTTDLDNSQTERTTSKSYFAEFTDTPSTPVEAEGGFITQRVTASTKKDPSTMPTEKTTTDTGPLNTTRSLPLSQRKRMKKKRVTSALLLSKATANEGAIPLPIISNERDRRPFFYYNGQREDAFVLPTIKTWSKHAMTEAGATPRERAIKSLSVANTFKDKPWLNQVRIALNIVTKPTKRNVRRLRRGAKKGAFAV